MAEARVVKGMPSVELTKEAFAERFKARFYDPEFDKARPEIDRLVEIAWSTYADYHKSPTTRKAGAGFSNPDYDLSLEWLATRERIREAEARHGDGTQPARILIVNGSSRSDQTCPGEMSKTFRLATLVREMVEKEPGFEADFLDLSRLASEYGRIIYPCK